MPDNGSPTVNTSLSVSGGEAYIAMGDIEFAVPVDRIEALLRVLEAARLIAGDPAAAGPPAPAAATSARTTSAPVRRRPAPPQRSAKITALSSKRRSRKRVGDALVIWMQQNPGWHHEEDLLQAVVDNRMTDANPKRALKIALGKQKDEIFETDEKGHWKLNDDKQAGPPPKARKSTGRKKKIATGRGGRKRAAAGPAGGKLGEAAKAISRSGRRVRLRTRPRSGEEAAAGATTPKAKGAKEARSGGRVVRVRKGQRRKEVTRPRSRAGSKGEAAKGSATGRWKVSQEELERARKNLFNLSSKGTPVKDEAGSDDKGKGGGSGS